MIKIAQCNKNCIQMKFNKKKMILRVINHKEWKTLTNSLIQVHTFNKTKLICQNMIYTVSAKSLMILTLWYNNSLINKLALIPSNQDQLLSRKEFNLVSSLFILFLMRYFQILKSKTWILIK